MGYTPEAIFIPASKMKTKPITVTIAGNDYNFPPNQKVSISDDILRLIIGNWNNPTDRDKELVIGRSTPICPRNLIYRVIDDTTASNLFGVVDISNLSTKTTDTGTDAGAGAGTDSGTDSIKQ